MAGSGVWWVLTPSDPDPILYKPEPKPKPNSKPEIFDTAGSGVWGVGKTVCERFVLLWQRWVCQPGRFFKCVPIRNGVCGQKRQRYVCVRALDMGMFIFIRYECLSLINMYEYIHTYAYMYICIRICMYTCTCVYICIYVYIYTGICIWKITSGDCLWISSYAYMYICTYIHIYTCVYSHIRLSIHI